MHIPHRLNSCTSLLSMNDNRTWQDFTQAKIKTPFSFAKPRKHISYYSLLQIAHDLICLFSSDPLRKFLVLSCRSSTLKRPSILCSVRDSGVSFYNNKPLLQPRLELLQEAQKAPPEEHAYLICF